MYTRKGCALQRCSQGADLEPDHEGMIDGSRLAGELVA